MEKSQLLFIDYIKDYILKMQTTVARNVLILYSMSNTQKTNSGTGGQILFKFSGITKNHPEISKKVIKIFQLDLKWPSVTPDLKTFKHLKTNANDRKMLEESEKISENIPTWPKVTTGDLEKHRNRNFWTANLIISKLTQMTKKKYSGSSKKLVKISQLDFKWPKVISDDLKKPPNRNFWTDHWIILKLMQMIEK